MNNESFLSTVFRKKFRGYDPQQVEDFRKNVAGWFAELRKDNEILRTQVASLEARLKTSRELETKLRRMLQEMESTSTKILDQSRSNAVAMASQSEFERKVLLQQAREEASVLIRDAEKRAELLFAESTGKMQSLMDDIGTLHIRRTSLISRMKALLLSQLDFLEALQKDIREPFDEVPTVAPARGRKEGVGPEELRSILRRLEELKGSEE